MTDKEGKLGEDDVYDAVFFAGPFHQSGVELLGTLASANEVIPYVADVRCPA